MCSFIPMVWLPVTIKTTIACYTSLVKKVKHYFDHRSSYLISGTLLQTVSFGQGLQGRKDICLANYTIIQVTVSHSMTA